MEGEVFEAQRGKMVATQIERRGIREPRLLDAFRSVPRHLFVPQDLAQFAYEDYPLQIGFDQTISQPYIAALMTSLLQLEGGETVLDIGTGSGYQAAILGRMAAEVISIELVPPLAERSAALLRSLGFGNITVLQGDGSCGWPERAPYRAILVAAAAPSPPGPLLEQLDEGGRLVIPIGPRSEQDLQVWRRTGGNLEYESIVPVVFVPLKGQHGWKPAV